MLVVLGCTHTRPSGRGRWPFSHLTVLNWPRCSLAWTHTRPGLFNLWPVGQMLPLLLFFWPARGCMQKIKKIKEKHSCMQIRFLCVAGDTSQYQYPTIRNWHHLFWQCLAQPIRVSLAFLIWMPSEQGHVAPWPMRSCMSVSGWAKLGKQGSAIFLTESLAQNVSYVQ